MTKENFDKKNKSSFKYWLLAGIAVLFLFFKLLSLPGWLNITIDVLSVLGGGVFASSLVAIAFEIIQKKERERQNLLFKKEIMTMLFIRLSVLIGEEIEIAIEALRILDKDVKWSKAPTKEFSPLEGIAFLTEKTRKIAGLITSQRIKQVAEPNKQWPQEYKKITALISGLNFGHSGLLRKRAVEDIDKMLSEEGFYFFNEIFDSSEIKELQNIRDYLLWISQETEKQDLPKILDYKQALYSGLRQFCQTFPLFKEMPIDLEFYQELIS